MAISVASLQSPTLSQAAWEVRAPATTRVKILEVSAHDSAGTARSCGLGRPAAIGVAPVSLPLQMHNPSDGISQVTYATVWNTSNPTAPTIYHRRMVTVTAIFFIWTFPRGLVIPVSQTVIVFNISTAPVCQWNIVVDE